MGIIERKNPSLVTLGQRFLSNWTVTGNFAGKKLTKEIHVYLCIVLTFLFSLKNIR